MCRTAQRHSVGPMTGAFQDFLGEQQFQEHPKELHEQQGIGPVPPLGAGVDLYTLRANTKHLNQLTTQPQNPWRSQGASFLVEQDTTHS